ncbi:hypothetical protein J2Y45_000402 [Dyadobacter sp. BE34]|uniref:Lipoprotein n=1 Tax=Dyadobacter fermentans TaxID=94254 RepID=A0ABU1QQ44_9BACT|nr:MULTISPECIES: hypothetical protein [Dyadobacter]MDR6803132.1 hypothetical protein [Dyadobacter fermentans]MDR7040874.1 hypothetical protein [Dyadobacter sp. BE242]MDR7195276.1 hypothetical protein [Dyadobacter sp. BE34]MDR7214178.1 hypothetical protein [Dyadobacter sp. BE31]MDR7260684.1 hypothetical protein [Dyadobacter sp. BE32]
MRCPLTTKLASILLLSAMMPLLSNCSGHKTTDQWDDATIDANLSKDSIYKQLDKEKEIFSALDDRDPLARRTSNVSYFSGKRIDLSDTQYAKYNNCRAYFWNTDTLSIKIGIGNGFGGQGFIINYKDKTFYTEAYLATDNIIPWEVKPTHKIVYQKLTLDKPKYVVGDSLFGKIEFKSIETDNEGERTEHFGKGHFRTKVSKF